MTTESFTPAPTYVIAATGPYAIPHPYQSAGELEVIVRQGGTFETLVLGTDFTVSPDVALTGGGDLTLSAAARVAYLGWTLQVTRQTEIEQGWAAESGPREKGLERQLDRLTQALQDYAGAVGRGIMLPVGSAFSRLLAPPSPGHTIIVNPEGTAFTEGPNAADIAEAEEHAAEATAAAAAAAASLATITHWIASQPISVREFGAYGNDTETSLVDERTQIQAAINAAIAQKRELIFPATNYQISGFIGKQAAGFDLHIRGVGGMPVIRPSQSLAESSTSSYIRFLLNSTEYAVTEQVPNLDLRVGDMGIRFSNTLPFKVGMHIGIQSTRLWPYDARDQWFAGEMHRIKRVTGSHVEIEDFVRDNYDIDVDGVTCFAFWPNRISLCDFGLDSPLIPTDEDTEGVSGISLGGAYRPAFDNVRVAGIRSTGIALSRCMYADINNADIERIGINYTDETVSEGLQGYGISLNSSLGSRITGGIFRGMRRAIDGNGSHWPNRDTIIDGIKRYGGGASADGTKYWPEGDLPSYGLGDHGPDENMTIRNCLIANVQNGVTFRGRNMSVHGVEFVGAFEEPIYATYGAGLEVANCRYWRGDIPQGSPLANFSAKWFARIGNSSPTNQPDYSLPLIIRNCTLEGLTEAIVYFSGTGAVVEKLSVKANTVYSTAEPDTDFFVLKGEAARSINNSDLSQNVMNRMRQAGALKFIDGNITLGAKHGGGGVELDRSVRIGDRQWIMTLGGGGDFCRLWTSGAGLMDDVPALVRIACADASISGFFEMAVGSGTLTPVGAVGGNLAGSSTAVIAAGGAADKFEIYRSARDFQFRNNRSGDKTITITIG